MVILKTRMAYTKKDEARYIAHLDLTRVFDRALRRAQIDAVYSEGFNPHPKISFGPPLPVGVEGEREYVDIELKGPEKEEAEQAFLADAVRRLQEQLPAGIEILDYAVRPQGSKAVMAIINLARYKTEVPFLEAPAPLRLKEACQNWLAKKEISGVRFQKGKKIERNIRPYVSRIDPSPQESSYQATVLFDIVTGNAGSVRPLEVLESLKATEGLPVDIPGVYTTRVGLYIVQADGGLLDPLEIISGKRGDS